LNIEIAYAAVNISVLPAWALLILAPRWKWTDKIVHRIWIPGLLCAAWVCILLFRPELPEGSGIGTLEQVIISFSSPGMALQIWAQLVIWDLFIGAWVGRDARRHGIHHGLVVPCLLGVFIIPPLGLLLYFIVRFVSKRVITLEESALLTK